MNILVTGANGQLGQCLRDLVERLDENDSSKWFWTDVNDIGRTVEHLDITDMSDVRSFIKRNEVDTIINCAAATNPDVLEDNITLGRALNVEAPKNLAIVCKEFNAKLIHVSTDYVFGDNIGIPRTEEDPTNPTSVYGKTKLEGEAMIKDSGCDYLIFRTAWLYSEHGNNFVKTMIKLMETKSDISVVSDQVGTPTYARDLAEIIYNAAVFRRDAGGIYHFTNDGVCSWYDFTKAIEYLCRTSGKFQNLAWVNSISTEDFYNGKPHAVRPHYSVLSKEKLARDFQHQYIPKHWFVSLITCVSNLLADK